MAVCGLEHLLRNGNRRNLRLPGLGKGLFVRERTIRRVITVVSILMLLVMAFGLGLQLLDHFHHIRKAQTQQFSLLLRLAANGLEGQMRAGESIRTPVKEDLERLLPTFAFDNGRVFVITDADGVVLAIAGRPGAGWPALREGEMLPGALRRIALSANGQGRILTHRMDNGLVLLTGSMPLSGWAGSVLLLQRADAGAGTFEADANMVLALFLGLFLVLVGLVSIYNWQAARAEEETEERAEFINRLEEALALGRCGLWDWDVPRGRIFLSRSMRWLLGLPMAEDYMDLADFLALQHPEDEPVDVLLEKRLEEGHTTFEHELRLRQADGGWLWLKLRGALPETREASRHLVGIAVDITAQKQATEAVRNAEERLMQAIESLSESFVLWDESMRMVMCNSKFREFHGLSDSACRKGRPFADIMAEARWPVRKRHFHRVYGEGSGHETIMELELTNGRWLQISEQYMEGGGFVSVGTDITELKRKQLELEQSRRELQETVRALEASQEEIEHKNRHLKMMARRYQQEKERAEEALRTKSRFLANVSHELFTPLNHILLSADLMQQQRLGALSDKYVDYARQILAAGQEVHRKIRDMLEYAQLSSGEVPLRPERTEIAPLLAEVAEQHMMTAEEKDVALSWRAPEGLAAEVDAERLEQALHQLVSNAVRFTDEGEVVLSAHGMDNGMVVLEVADTGIGIPPEKIAQIGKPFERAGEAYNSHRGGSGIGLAIAKAIVEMHGGRMEIDSAPGRGTRVRLVLPMVRQNTASRKDVDAEGDHTGRAEAGLLSTPAE